MNRHIYRKTAKKYGVTISEVKQDMQKAINAAYWNPDRNLINIKAQNAVPKKDDVPTPDELIHQIADEVREKKEYRKMS